MNAIVTGASRGIGRAIACKLADEGARVMLCARDEASLEQAQREIGPNARAISLDLREPDAAPALVDEAVRELGGIDVLVNNAGATKRGAFEGLSEDDWTDGFALKFFGAVRVTRAAWPHLRRSGGSVVYIAGTGGRTPGPQFAVGGSVNAALLSLTKSLADTGVMEGVQVNAVNPGSIRTDRLKSRLESIAFEHATNLPEAEQQLVRETHVTRIGMPEDIAELVAFIVSPAGRFLQGALIDMDGGQTKSL